MPRQRVIAIDVDNTLIRVFNRDGEPEECEHVAHEEECDHHIAVNEDVRDFVRSIKRLGIAKLVLWSGGGADYARHVAYAYGLTYLFDQFAAKNDPKIDADICLDDQECRELARVGLKLPGDIQPTPWLGV